MAAGHALALGTGADSQHRNPGPGPGTVAMHNTPVMHGRDRIAPMLASRAEQRFPCAAQFGGWRPSVT